MRLTCTYNYLASKSSQNGNLTLIYLSLYIKYVHINCVKIIYNLHNNCLLTKEFKNIVIRWLRMHCQKKKPIDFANEYYSGITAIIFKTCSQSNQSKPMPVYFDETFWNMLNTLCKLRIFNWWFFSDTFFREERSQFYVIDPPHLYFRSLIQTIDIIVKLLSYINTTFVKEPLV